jgi:hypothetical protein
MLNYHIDLQFKKNSKSYIHILHTYKEKQKEEVIMYNFFLCMCKISVTPLAGPALRLGLPKSVPSLVAHLLLNI